MFRNPRENAEPSIQTPVKPSTGRPPTPPDGTPHSRTVNMVAGGSTKPLTPRATSKTNASTLNRQSAKKAASTKIAGKTNASILSFFKKVDNPLHDDSIFLSQGSHVNALDLPPRNTSPDTSEIDTGDLYGDEENIGVSRFNEVGGPLKKRKTLDKSTPSAEEQDDGNDAVEQGTHVQEAECTPPPESHVSTLKSSARVNGKQGPFLSDSESEDEVENAILQSRATAAERLELQDMAHEQLLVETCPVAQEAISENKPVIPAIHQTIDPEQRVLRQRKVPVSEAQAKWEALQPKHLASKEPNGFPKDDVAPFRDVPPIIPHLKKEATSIDEWGKFDDLEAYPEDDEYAEGEEYVERRFMEEQAILEAEEVDDDTYGAFDDDDYPTTEEPPDEQTTVACPICSSSLKGIDSDLATRHVNGCLDGHPIPLPEPIKTELAEIKLMPEGAKNRFARRAAIARPGQANPFDLGTSNTGPSSAFSKLMSGKAEDAAWASAAAAEHASRGKPAYQRTCPFYKIMPGFFICVDAFRYGAVQGCNGYFLSHFHSDHYIGLTSSWCHGPIYCSKVTANLVIQQLRVDPKYVVALTFDRRVGVPGTQGVDVTMIPANHCPGSSLFLFEKVIGKGPKVQRVLHCGDFRACPAHIAHPLLMPDLVDSITGKTKQQKIDVCYLDTTYLNPRYAFPSQEDVIQACADMCVSLRKERAEENDAWETMKRERAGTGMTKFISSAAPKPTDDSIAMSLTSSKPRGRLLVVCGTYSIGKERICLGIARALDCKIFAPPGKMRICAALEDPELMSRMTSDPREAQIHMQMLMEIRPETLQDYLNGYKPHFSRVVGFRPSGWNYKPPAGRATQSPTVPLIINSPSWRSSFHLADLVPQRGSTREASCFGVPYSEHSSFRELTMFVCALRIEKIVPTVNVGSGPGRARMKGWIDKWLAERRKNGLIKIGDGEDEVKW